MGLNFSICTRSVSHEDDDEIEIDPCHNCTSLEKRVVALIEYTESKTLSNKLAYNELKNNEMKRQDILTKQVPITIRVRSTFPLEKEGCGIVLVLIHNQGQLESVISCSGRPWFDISQRINQLKKIDEGRFTVVFYDPTIDVRMRIPDGPKIMTCIRKKFSYNINDLTMLSRMQIIPCQSRHDIYLMWLVNVYQGGILRDLYNVPILIRKSIFSIESFPMIDIPLNDTFDNEEEDTRDKGKERVYEDDMNVILPTGLEEKEAMHDIRVCQKYTTWTNGCIVNLIQTQKLSQSDAVKVPVFQ